MCKQKMKQGKGETAIKDILSEEGTFELKLEWQWGTSLSKIWGMGFPGNERAWMWEWTWHVQGPEGSQEHSGKDLILIGWRNYEELKWGKSGSRKASEEPPEVGQGGDKGGLNLGRERRWRVGDKSGIYFGEKPGKTCWWTRCKEWEQGKMVVRAFVCLFVCLL